jgi:predicted ATPase
MRVDRIEVDGYRSLRKLRLGLGRVTVIVGQNGSGKTNLYQSLHLLSAAARGSFARTIASEGGMGSLLWAGGRKKGPVRVGLSVRLEEWDYSIEFGLPEPTQSVFQFDPWIKTEILRLHQQDSPVTMLDRKGPSAMVRDVNGRPAQVPLSLSHAESALAQIRDPERYPELERVRRQMEAWRFYHAFETHAGAPARQPQVGVTTPVLSTDGCDLAAALKTIRHIGDVEMLDRSIKVAFPGSELALYEDAHGLARLSMEMPGLQRPLDTAELSDGTLRYLCLLAALLTPRPPALLALNEPETSLHDGLLEPLGELIARASRNSQVWVTTHSDALAAAIAKYSDPETVRLVMKDGQTCVEGQSRLD